MVQLKQRTIYETRYPIVRFTPSAKAVMLAFGGCLAGHSVPDLTPAGVVYQRLALVIHGGCRRTNRFRYTTCKITYLCTRAGTVFWISCAMKPMVRSELLLLILLACPGDPSFHLKVTWVEYKRVVCETKKIRGQHKLSVIVYCFESRND